MPDQNPSGLGTFSFNLRFPGQYYDSETGLAYNGARDYDAATGKYVESDPIGLKGGVSTYAYVDGSPTSNTDPWGLQGFPEVDPIEELPPAVRESNRWNDPWRQMGREFSHPPLPFPSAPKPQCTIQCPAQDECKIPVAAQGVPVPGQQGCYMRCSTGPFLSAVPTAPAPPTPPPRQMSRGDWFNLAKLIRAIIGSW